ncbi:MAG: (d)CMP kinase, partial [Rubripirellula sp.]|nr:(d)CMP kinase [Rubripirellula sp.]
RPLPLEEILRAQDQCYEEDRQRHIGYLRPADDAIIIDSDGMTSEKVLELILKTVQDRHGDKQIESKS